MSQPPGLRYPIALVEQAATVTIEFASFRPGVAEIVAALEEALAMEKARLRSVLKPGKGT